MRIAIVFLLCAAGLFGAHLKAGVARIEITPAEPVWMSGYAARSHPSTGVLVRLWAKALAFESSRNRRIVIVTADVVGIPRAVTDEVAARAQAVWSRALPIPGECEPYPHRPDGVAQSEQPGCARA